MDLQIEDRCMIRSTPKNEDADLPDWFLTDDDQDLEAFSLECAGPEEWQSVSTDAPLLSLYTKHSSNKQHDQATVLPSSTQRDHLKRSDITRKGLQDAAKRADALVSRSPRHPPCPSPSGQALANPPSDARIWGRATPPFLFTFSLSKCSLSKNHRQREILCFTPYWCI